MKKQLVLLGAVVAATLTLASCHNHEYIYHEAVESTYLAQGSSEYYTCKDCDLVFDKDKNPIESLDAVKLDVISYDTTVASIDDEGVIHVSATVKDFKDIYFEKYTLTVKIGDKTYEAPTVRWAEEVKTENAYVIVKDDISVGLRDKKLSEETSAKVGDKVSFSFKKNGYESEIPFFNVKSSSDVTLYGKDIKVTFDDSKEAEYEAMVEQILKDVAEGTVTTEHPSTENAKSYEDVDAEYQEFVNAYYFCVDQYRYASIIADTTTEEDDYNKESAIMAVAQEFEVWDQQIDIAMSKSIYRNQFFEDMTDEEIDEYIQKLDPETTAAANEYQKNMDEAINGYKAGNTEAFQALTTYVQNATEYAKLKGYSDYISYAYKEVYDRDYAPSETNSLENCIKDYIVPVYKDSQATFTKFSKGRNKNPDVWNGFIGVYFDFFGIYFDQLEDYAAVIGGDYQKNFKQYFLDGDYFFSKEENDNVTGYVSTYSNGHPLMFLGPDYQGVKTWIHEFGHYNANATKGDTGSYDLSETQSQGNEMLFFTYLEKQGVIDEEIMNQFTNYMTYAMTDAILEGYLYNEVEKFLYTTDLTTLTKEGLSNEWDNICKAAGLDDYVGGFNIKIPLNYHCYYISYASSAIAALEIYAKAKTDWDGAIECYTKIYQEHDKDSTFKSVIADAGLYDIFTEDAYKLIAKAYPTIFNQAQ